MHVTELTAQCCTAQGPDSPPRRGPVPKLLWADLLNVLMLGYLTLQKYEGSWLTDRVED